MYPYNRLEAFSPVYAISRQVSEEKTAFLATVPWVLRILHVTFKLLGLSQQGVPLCPTEHVCMLLMICVCIFLLFFLYPGHESIPTNQEIKLRCLSKKKTQWCSYTCHVNRLKRAFGTAFLFQCFKAFLSHHYSNFRHSLQEGTHNTIQTALMELSKAVPPSGIKPAFLLFALLRGDGKFNPPALEICQPHR